MAILLVLLHPEDEDIVISWYGGNHPTTQHKIPEDLNHKGWKLRTEVNKTSKLSSNCTVTTNNLHYEEQPVNDVWGTNQSLLWETYTMYKYTLWAGFQIWTLKLAVQIWVFTTVVYNVNYAVLSGSLL